VQYTRPSKNFWMAARLYIRWRVAGGGRVILCLPPSSRSMEFTFSSRTRNALLSANNYEISSCLWRDHPNISLRASCTAMGLITYTLTLTSGREGDSPQPSVLTWTDIILTYKDRDPLSTFLPTAVSQTANHWLTLNWGSLTEAGEIPSGERYWEAVRRRQNFWDACDQAFRVTTSCIMNDWWRFASVISDQSQNPIVEEPETNFESFLP